MSNICLSSKVRTARKDYHCDACEVINDALSDCVRAASFAERRHFVEARRDGWRIKAGQKYIDYRGKFDGDLYTLRMRPAIAKIVSAHDWWPEA